MSIFLCIFKSKSVVWNLRGERRTLDLNTFFEPCHTILLPSLFSLVWKVPSLSFLCPLVCVPCFVFLSQDRIKLRKLRIGMGKSKRKMAKSGCVVTWRSRPVLNPQGPARSKRDVRTFGALPKSKKHVQGIVHNGKARGHTAVFDTGSQQLMIGQDSW